MACHPPWLGAFCFARVTTLTADDTDRHCQPAPTFFHGNLVHKSPKWGLQTGFFLEFHLVADHEMPSAGKSAVFCAFCGDDPREPA
jgi:hypothetical protein